MPKIEDRYSDDKNERDYIKRMSLRDTRSWFRMRSRKTLRIKANRSSVFRSNMECTHLCLLVVVFAWGLRYDHIVTVYDCTF